MLLIFSLGYAGWIRARPRAAGPARPRHLAGHHLLALVAVVSVATFLIRLQVPLGKSNLLLSLNMWEWPACLAIFALGIGGFRSGWLTAVPDPLRRQCRTATLVTFAAFMGFVGVAEALGVTDEQMWGGWHWAALSWAVFESALAVFGIAGLSARRPGPPDMVNHAPCCQIDTIEPRSGRVAGRTGRETAGPRGRAAVQPERRCAFDSRSGHATDTAVRHRILEITNWANASSESSHVGPSWSRARPLAVSSLIGRVAFGIGGSPVCGRRARLTGDMGAALVVVVVIALGFDFSNGFHDSSNAIAAPVATGAMTPGQAVTVAGTFNLLGPIIAGTAVADTVGGIVTLGPSMTLTVLTCALSAALTWNLLTWWRGLPSSSSHALVGGLVGAGLATAGVQAINWGGFNGLHPVGVVGILVVLALSPLIGGLVGYLGELAVRRGVRRARRRIERPILRGEWVTAASLAFANGTNDAQKTMGVITTALVAAGALSRSPCRCGSRWPAPRR